MNKFAGGGLSAASGSVETGVVRGSPRQAQGAPGGSHIPSNGAVSRDFWALDLFCGAGGATRGLQMAGFKVVGVDIKRQPRYVGEHFIQADALAPPVRLADFDLVWASPVCKRYTAGAAARMRAGTVYPDQIPAIRALLAPYRMTVIENVPTAPLRPDLVLHGHMFPELRVIRHRKFEVSFGPFLTAPCPKGLLRQGYFCVVGNGTPSGVRDMGLADYTADQTRAAMGTPWMSKAEVCQAIPPAYSEFIGRAALKALAS